MQPHSGNIDQRTAICEFGIPSNCGPVVVSANFAVDPETLQKRGRRAFMLTPKFRLPPHIRASAWRWSCFNITIKNEVTQLGPRNIWFGCYNSQSFPTDPLCSLLARSTSFDPYGITTITDRYVNGWGSEEFRPGFHSVDQAEFWAVGVISHLTGNATQQESRMKSRFSRAAPLLDNNRRGGDPKFVADLSAIWKPANGWSIFWGTEWYGHAWNKTCLFSGRNGGSPVRTVRHRSGCL